MKTMEIKNDSILTDVIKIRYIWDEYGRLSTVFSLDTQDFYSSVILEKCPYGVIRDWIRNWSNLFEPELNENTFNEYLDNIVEYIECTNKMFPNSIMWVDKRQLPPHYENKE